MTEQGSAGAGERDEREPGTRRHGATGLSGAAGSGQPEVQPVPASPGPRVPESAPAIAPSEVLAWLDAREAPPPPELRERMAAALAEAKSETLPGALAEAALACLKATVERPAERASALDLLAADALLTYALEAAAELGAETLRRIAGEYGAEPLGRILAEEHDE